MRKIKVLLSLVLCLVLLTACGGGDVRNVKRNPGESQLYSEGEINFAMNEVIDFFEKEFDGCTMTEIRYDEEKYAKRQSAESEDYGSDVMILLTDFDVDSSGGDGSLNPNSTYRNYQWTLTRTLFGWEIRDWGYG